MNYEINDALDVIPRKLWKVTRFGLDLRPMDIFDGISLLVPNIDYEVYETTTNPELLLESIIRINKVQVKGKDLLDFRESLFKLCKLINTIKTTRNGKYRVLMSKSGKVFTDSNDCDHIIIKKDNKYLFTIAK